MTMESCKYHIKSSHGVKRLYFDCTKCREKGDLSSQKCLRNTLGILYNENIYENIHQLQYNKKYYKRIYYSDQLKILYEFLNTIDSICSENPWDNICDCGGEHREWRSFLENLIKKEAIKNPIKAYEMLSYLKNQYNEEYVVDRYPIKCVKSYTKIIEHLLKRFESTLLIKKGKKISDIFKSVVQPSFLSSIIEFRIPQKAKILDRYKILNSEIKILENGTDRFYFIKPSEISLSFNEVKILQKLRDIISDKYIFELIDPIDARNHFQKLGMELLKKFDTRDIDKKRLSEIFTRYTAGYGILEILFYDEKIKDIYVDSPPTTTPIYIDHEEYGICTTNIKLSEEDLERISSKFRSIGGRPFDEANPIMDMELQDMGIRVAGVRQPSTFDGIAFAFRKRRERPWTLPMFVKEGMMSAKSAAILSYLVSGRCSILITGARGSGKTSLLTALMSEIRQSDRIVLMEDTPEIPVSYFKRHGWKIEHLRNQPPVSKNRDYSYELSPEQNLRAALRLGESVLIIGEVRGPEAKALFEAMRIGAAGNAVLGTIHGSTPYDTWDRVTNDLQVPSTSFKAVDVVLSLGYRENRESIQKKRYLISITEVKKIYENNPQMEGAFFDIMYLKEDLEEHFNLEESELIRKIAIQKNMHSDEYLKNIELRERMIRDIVRISKNRNIPELLEIENVVKANKKYIYLINKNAVTDTEIDYEKLYHNWKRWLEGYIDKL